MTTKVSYVRNVNGALSDLVRLTQHEEQWRKISPRGMETREFIGTHITEYSHPRERVLFSHSRDANPFFHFFESLWILAGREDVAYPAQFSGNISNYSDDGLVFHAPYGKRMRSHFVSRDEEPCDQLKGIVTLLKKDPDTRRAVMCYWSPVDDLGYISYIKDGEFKIVESRDIACNDLMMLKLRDNSLDITVSCRSNDAIWGAYGANAVQFSMVQEFIALAVGCNVGVYRQISDSFHIYTDNEAWKRIVNSTPSTSSDYYRLHYFSPYPIINKTNWEDWLFQNERFVDGTLFDGTIAHATIDSFFKCVAHPMLRAHKFYRGEGLEVPHEKNKRIDMAIAELHHCAAPDWKLACEQWLERRRTTGS